MAFYDLGPAILLNGKTMRPLSVRDREELQECVGYPHDEPRFKAGMRFANIVLASVIGSAISGSGARRSQKPGRS